MSMLDICSNNSYWRGLDYYEDNRVKSLTQINESEYDATVEGNELYHVHLNVDHPRKSTCTCPHAAGKSTICKHKVAVYLSVFPEEAQKIIDDRDRYYEELERRKMEYDKKLEEERERLEKYVNSLSEEQARMMLVNYMMEDAMQYEEDPYEEEEEYWQ